MKGRRIRELSTGRDEKNLETRGLAVRAIASRGTSNLAGLENGRSWEGQDRDILRRRSGDENVPRGTFVMFATDVGWQHSGLAVA